MFRSLDEGWLNLDGAAVVEVTSEEKEYPVESALVSGQTRGWRAADSGAQTIRLVFDESQRLKRIALVFEETEIRAYPRVRLAMVCGWTEARFKRLCASSGISVPLTQYAMSRSIGSNSQGSTFLNWSLCPTSAEEWLTPR
jgi:hypothetical protein